MKKIKLILLNFDHNKIKAFLLTCILTVALTVLSYNFNFFLIEKRAYDIYNEAKLENSVYFMPVLDIETLESEIDKEKIEQFDAVQDIVLYRYNNLMTPEMDRILYIRSCDLPFLDAFDVSDGKGGFTEIFNGEVEAIVSGYGYRDVDIGDYIEVATAKEGNDIIKLKVVGKREAPDVRPSFSGGGTELETRDIVSGGEDVIYIRKEDEKYLYADPYGFENSHCCFIRLKNDAKKHDCTDLFSYLSQNGGYVSYEKILANSKQEFALSSKQNFILPVSVLLFIAFLSILFSALSMSRKLKRSKGFFLCGYNQAEFFLNYSIAESFPLIIAGIVNTVLINSIPILYEKQLIRNIWPDATVLLSNETILFIWAYLLLVLLLSLLIPYGMVKKHVIAGHNDGTTH